MFEEEIGDNIWKGDWARNSKRWDMNVLDSRLFLERRRASKVSCSGYTMYTFGGTVMEGSCGVWWIGDTALVNGDGF